MNHFDVCKKILLEPEDFFSNLPKDEWYNRPLTFMGINGFLLAFISTLIVFLNQYIPMGATLIEGIKGAKLAIITPAAAMLAFNFFTFTFLILSGLMLGAFFAVFFLTGAGAHFFLKDKNQEMNDMLAAVFYSSAAIVFFAIPIASLFFVKKGLFTFSNFVVLYYLVCLISVLFLARLLNSAASRLYSAEKNKILLVSLIPILVLIFAGGIFGLKILPKIAPLIT